MRRAPNLFFGACLFACGAPPAPVEAQPAPEPPPPLVSTPTPKVPPRHLRVHHPRELVEAELGDLVALDLALSLEDRRARAGDLREDLDYGQACAELDLLRLAERVPALTQLRLSGCPTAARSGLTALPGLHSLELADLTLDGVVMGQIAALPALRSLTLTRVAPGAEPSSLLARARIEALTLRDLDTDSSLAAAIPALGQLRSLALEGAWAGHEAMLKVAEAARLEEVRLIDTRVGNFSLHQLKPLAGLRRLDWRGSTFNDYSPLYVRDLPLEEFSCACPGLGDSALKTLGRQLGLRRLALLQSKITGGGLAGLAKLARLESLEIRQRDIGPEGLQALAALPQLAALTLALPPEASPSDPKLTHLGELVGLRRLKLEIPRLDDRVTGELSRLTGLVELDLGGTQLSDLGLKAVAEMHALRVLRLHHTRITSRGLAHLARLTRLEELELDHTDLVDAGVAHLKGLSELRALRLDATLITDDAIPHLLGMHKLERVNLADTVVTTAGAAQLGALPSLRAVNLAGTREG